MTRNKKAKIEKMNEGLI